MLLRHLIIVMAQMERITVAMRVTALSVAVLATQLQPLTPNMVVGSVAPLID
jgi:hypothetical protein